MTRSSSSSIGSHDSGPGKPPFPLFTAVSHACFRLKLRRVNFEPPLRFASDSVVGGSSWCCKGIPTCCCGAFRASRLTDDADEISQHFRHTNTKCTTLRNRRIVRGDNFVSRPPSLFSQISRGSLGCQSERDREIQNVHLRRIRYLFVAWSCGEIPYLSVFLFPGFPRLVSQGVFLLSARCAAPRSPATIAPLHHLFPLPLLSDCESKTKPKPPSPAY